MERGDFNENKNKVYRYHRGCCGFDVYGMFPSDMD
jgi:hypothetical protein